MRPFARASTSNANLTRSCQDYSLGRQDKADHAGSLQLKLSLAGGHLASTSPVPITISTATSGSASTTTASSAATTPLVEVRGRRDIAVVLGPELRVVAHDSFRRIAVVDDRVAAAVGGTTSAAARSKVASAAVRATATPARHEW